MTIETIYSLSKATSILLFIFNNYLFTAFIATANEDRSTYLIRVKEAHIFLLERSHKRKQNVSFPILKTSKFSTAFPYNESFGFMFVYRSSHGEQ